MADCQRSLISLVFYRAERVKMAVERNGRGVKPAGIPKWLVAAVDIALANLGLYLGFVLATGELQGFQIGPLFFLLPSVSLVTVLLFNNLGLYSRQRSGFMTVARSLITGVIGLTLFSILFAFWTKAFIFERSIFLAAPFFQLLLLFSWRILYWRLEQWIRGQQKLLVIGGRSEVEQALDKIMHLPQGLFEVIKVLEPEKIDQCAEWLLQADAVMIAGSLNLEEKNRVIRDSLDRNIEVFIIPDLYEITLTRASMTQVHDTPVIECRDLQLNFLQQFTKRAFDLVFVFIVALPALVLLFLTVPAIRLTSTGPAIYAQERVGLRGRLFTLYKLRTMIVEAEEESGPVFSSEEDDRVTPVGRFLRAARLDELPQIYNVLRGDLSIVGPRPERPYFVELFQQEMPEYKLRHLVKPGITGLAQVAGYYATNTHDKLRYDLYYLSDYSLFMDLRILLLTIPTLFNREAALGIKDEVGLREISPTTTLSRQRGGSITGYRED
jgi:exopolysaccharide biosynthesis polyprenyl glycosylphosphotransferase